jgi:hypothetical protein
MEKDMVITRMVDGRITYLINMWRGVRGGPLTFGTKLQMHDPHSKEHVSIKGVDNEVITSIFRVRNQNGSTNNSVDGHDFTSSPRSEVPPQNR